MEKFVSEAGSEAHIDQLRHKAFMTNAKADIDAFHAALRIWFSERHYRAVEQEHVLRQHTESNRILALQCSELSKLAEERRANYRYIGKDGKAVLARDLEDERDELRLKLADAQSEWEAENDARRSSDRKLRSALREIEALKRQFVRLKSSGIKRAIEAVSFIEIETHADGSYSLKNVKDEQLPDLIAAICEADVVKLINEELKEKSK
jgi:hypothetical protein